VAVGDELARLRAGAGEAEAPDDVVEAALKELKECLAGDAGAVGGFGEVAVELALEEAIHAPQLLLLAELDAIIGDSAAGAGLSAFARGVGPLLDGALAREAARALEVEADAFSTA